LNRAFLEPVLIGAFPDDVQRLYSRYGAAFDGTAEDLRLFREASADFVGVNYYMPYYVRAGAPSTQFFLNISGRAEEECTFAVEGLFRFVRNRGGRYTAWGWEIDPSGLHELLVRVERLRPGVPVYVTENGIGLNDRLEGGTVDDAERIAFVREHLEAVHRAIADGANVRGYYMWSLLDNFSWLNGYKKRYGFLYVDRATLSRHKKKSAYWFKQVAEAGGLVQLEGTGE
jgi:beta-glucosidase/6-phospho-beta-glucosidase/beta-galactosidase